MLASTVRLKFVPFGLNGSRIANSQFIATLPPAMLADDDARIELFTEARPGPHSAGRGAHINPISIL